jgi:SAM-dependent methyltransferase
MPGPRQDFSSLNPTGRFTGRSSVYARYRPSYPRDALAHIVAHCGLGSDSLLVDVGCGTGISSRLFAALGVNVIGIEPNAEMRASAAATAHDEGRRLVTYCEGRAECTGLPASIADAVLAAQAFHWFEPGPALREFHRILKSRGYAILMWNEGDVRDPFTQAYNNVVSGDRDAESAGSTWDGQAANALLASPLFGEGQRLSYTNDQTLDEEGLLGRAFSASYSPTDSTAASQWAEGLRAIFAKFHRDGRVTLWYETSVYLARGIP